MPRPRTFDETEVLDAALGSFWARGYEATSVRDLALSMGISGPSLYNAFNDKRSLYIEALQHYCRTRTYPLVEAIEREHTGVGAIAAFFAEIIDRSIADGERRGCFLINTALEVAPHDPEIRAIVWEHLGEVRAFVVRCLESDKPRAATRATFDIDATADHLISVLLGLRVLARTRPERPFLQGIVAASLSALQPPRRIERSPKPSRKRQSR